MSKTKITSLQDSKIRIIGENILYINDSITAYYLLPLSNYVVTSSAGANFSIQQLTNLLQGLCTQRKDLRFTLQRFSKTIRKKDVINNLYETIKLYSPEYTMPEEFTYNLSDNVQDFCLLGVGIDEDTVQGVEDSSLTGVAKQLFSNFANRLLNVGGVPNEDIILKLEENIFSILRTRCMRASKELVFYNYISKLYPSYDISYDKISYINDNTFSDIMGVVTQTMEDNFGYFIMHNEGVDFFDLEPQDTYGCVLDIVSFPLYIESSNFSMVDYPGIQVNLKHISKEQALLKLKRTRSSDRYDLEELMKAGGESEQYEGVSENIDIATYGIKQLEEGVSQMCEFNVTMLVTGRSLPELRQNVQYCISDLKDRDILPAKSLHQVSDYINGYVKLNFNHYRHFADIQFPLCFQLNSGSLIFESDSKYSVPSIGEDLA